MAIGRPPEWTDERKVEAQAKICVLLAEGWSLRKICEEIEDMPSRKTVHEWLCDDTIFCDHYARARERQADTYADEITEIADTELQPDRARVRIDARKWAASKLKPKVYGDRLELDASVGLKVSDEQLDSRIAQLLGKAGIDGASGGEGAA